MNILIYKLIDPLTNQIRYVGKTKKSLRKRLYEHLTKRNLKPNTHKNNWIKKLLRSNLKPKIELIERATEENWIAKEIFWIAKFKKEGHSLTNGTEGGEGCVSFHMSPATIQKILDTKRRNGTLKHTAQTIEKIRKSKMGIKHKPGQTEKISLKTRKYVLRYDNNRNIIDSWLGVRKCCKELKINRTSLWKAIKQNSLYLNSYWQLTTRL